MQTESLEVKYDSSGNARIVFPRAAKVRGKIIKLNDAPVDSVNQLRVDSPADRCGKRRVREAARADVRAADQHMRER